MVSDGLLLLVVGNHEPWKYLKPSRYSCHFLDPTEESSESAREIIVNMSL